MKKGKALSSKVRVSDELAAFMGESEVKRTDITKALWAHIKKYDLNVGKNIKADKTLASLIGKKNFDMFEMQKLIQKHIIKD